MDTDRSKVMLTVAGVDVTVEEGWPPIDEELASRLAVTVAGLPSVCVTVAGNGVE
jgi:hypothetical protein